MRHDENAKPRLAGRGKRSLWQWVAFVNYRFALEGASTCLPLWPVAVDGAGSVLALLWGGLQ